MGLLCSNPSDKTTCAAHYFYTSSDFGTLDSSGSYTSIFYVWGAGATGTEPPGIWTAPFPPPARVMAALKAPYLRATGQIAHAAATPTVTMGVQVWVNNESVKLVDASGPATLFSRVGPISGTSLDVVDFRWSIPVQFVLDLNWGNPSFPWLGPWIYRSDAHDWLIPGDRLSIRTYYTSTASLGMDYSIRSSIQVLASGFPDNVDPDSPPR